MAIFSKLNAAGADDRADVLDDFPRVAVDPSPSDTNVKVSDVIAVRAGDPVADDDHQDDDHGLVDVDKRLAALARKITGAKKRLVDSVLTIGEHLAEAQTLLADHAGGQFNRWVKQRCHFTPRTAYKYLACWRTFGSCELGSQRRFDVTAMHLLAQDATPQAAIEAAIEKADAGDRITAKDARSILAQHTTAKARKDTRPVPVIIETVSGSVAIRQVDGASIELVLMAALDQVRQRQVV